MNSLAERTEREKRIADAIRRLPGVVGANIWLDETGSLRDLRVTALPSSPAVIVANATAAVLRQHGLTVAPDTVSVSHDRVPEPEPAAAAAEPAGPASRFLILHELTVQRGGGRITCAVQLDCRGELYTGEASEIDSGTGRIRAAARATLAAAAPINTRVSLSLEATSDVEMFGRTYVAVSVEGTAGRRFVHLNGFVAHGRDRSVEEAATMAALRAIERWIAA